MQLRFTAAGKNIFDTNPTAFQVTRLVLTDAFGYVLPPVPSSLQGNTVYDQTAELSVAIDNTNTLRFTKLLDNTIGTFQFGEAGLYSGATLVAVGVNPTPISKIAASGTDNGNQMTLNFFLTYNNTNSYGFVKLGNSDSRYQLGQVQHLDYLDPPYEGDPNAYVVNGLTPTDVPDFAFVDFFGRWNFAAKPQRYYTGEVVLATDLAVDIATPHGVVFGLPTDYVIQFISGKLRGYCRELVSIGSTFFQWNTPTLLVPEPGDQFLIVGPRLSNITISGQTNIQFQDEGVNLGTPGTVDTFNVVAPNGILSRVGNTVTLTLDLYPDAIFQEPLQILDEGVELGGPGDVTNIDFVGAGVEATLNGDTLTVAIDGGAVKVQTYSMSAEFPTNFSGLGYTDWTVAPLYAVPASPFVTNAGDGVFEFTEAGTYKVTIATGVDGGEGLPNLLSGFGYDLAPTIGAVVASPSPTVHTRFSGAAFTPGDNTTFTYGPWSIPAYGFTWTDTFYVIAPAGSQIEPTLYLYNYNEESAPATPTAVISFEKVSSSIA